VREPAIIFRICVLLFAMVPSLARSDEILRDPTRPYLVSASTAAVAPSFTVNAIIISAERKVAIVNGRRVAVGGSVDGATVLTIEQDHLVLEKDGEHLTAPLRGGAPRQTKKSESTNHVE